MQFTEQNKAKILIVDDHPIVRQGVALLINREPELSVCHEAETADQALACLQQCAHDLAIIDLSLGDMSGLELVKKLRAQFPDLPILVMSMHDETIYAERLLRAGARGYLMKQAATDTMLKAVRTILQGDLYVSPRMQAQMLQHKVSGAHGMATLSQLTSGEFEVLHLISTGMSASDIATRLGRSVKTIDSHRANIRKKLNLKTSNELTHFAIKWATGAANL